MAAGSSVDLESDPRAMIGTRARVIKERGADKGLAETLARLAGYAAGLRG